MCVFCHVQRGHPQQFASLHDPPPPQISKEKTIWFNCRQEPVAYVGGQSVTARSLFLISIVCLFVEAVAASP